MKNQSKKLLSLFLAVLMLTTLLAGCGGTPSTTPTGNTPAASTAPDSTPEGNASNLPAGDGVLNVGSQNGLDTLTPFRANIMRDHPILKPLFEALAVINVDREVEPWVAKNWSTEDNGFNYDIEIWDIVTDSEGNHITASDIVWFIQRSMEAALKPAYSKIESVEQTGDYTLRVTLKTNLVGTFERILEDTFVISQAAFEASADSFGSHAVTTSAYKVVNFTASSVLAFEKRDDYWQNIEFLPASVRPMVEKVTYHTIAEASQLGIALETGIIDVAYQIPAATGVQFVDNDEFTFDPTEGPQGYQLFFSGSETSYLFDNLALRQAICYSIDPQGLITGFASGYGDFMYDVCPPGMIGFNPAWKNENYYDYDIEKAKQLVVESGYNGEELVFLATNSMQRLVEILQNYMAAIGVNVKLDIVDMALYTATRLDGTKYDMTINTIGGTFMPDHWSIRYDPAAYATGDATSRHDYVLGDLLYKTWTPSGFTPENINEVRKYIRDNAIAYGLMNANNIAVWNNNVDMQERVLGFSNAIAPSACIYGNV